MRNFKNRMVVYIALLVLIIFFVLAGWILFPKFLESLKYEAKQSEGPFQLRHYEKFVETKIKTYGSQSEALRMGFVPLARFIGAKYRQSEKISMTVPVIQRKIETNDNWFISFSMPSKYTLETLPSPKRTELLQGQVSKALMAAVKFNGIATEDLLNRKEQLLLNWIAKLGYKPIGTVHYYFYNDPLTPGFFRRNEVLFEVSKIE